MVWCPAFGNQITIYAPLPVISLLKSRDSSSFTLKKPINCRRFASQISRSTILLPSTPTSQQNNNLSDVHYASLRMLEWDKLCDLVASFASTSLGREAIKVLLWSVDRTYEESLRLLEETDAAVEMHKHGACRLDFTGIDLLLVKHAIGHARRGLSVSANEAMAVATMLEFADFLKLNLESAIKEDVEWYNRFMPLSQRIAELVITRPLVRMIWQIIDNDGSVKDTASSALKRSRDQVRVLEKKEVSNINGRWCIKSGTNQMMSFKGLLLSSDSGTGSIVEPLTAVPLNDELQGARASVAKAEADVLLNLTEKMQKDLDDIEKLLNHVIQLDVINARATYSLSFGGASPDLYLPQDMHGPFSSEASAQKASKTLFPSKRDWVLYMPKAYHPLLLLQHKQNMQEMRKDARNSATKLQKDANKVISGELQGNNGTFKGETDTNPASLEVEASKLKPTYPVPVDFFIARKTRVLVITGPNTGGKTICLKTVGLAAMMAKSGLHVLSSESVQLPWFDHILADIGDEQSLSQSLSTFSGHLKQISDIRSQSTNQSLVLLDEVGAGTNPLEGAALGMSLLESFADNGALLTIATTHHGELKSLKYSNCAFENACMEFDEVNLKPKYKILWGVPGRSNAINISEKLGVPDIVISKARELFGAASAEINEVIIDMERFKQDFQELLYKGQHHLTLSRKLHEKLRAARLKIMEHGSGQRYRKMQEIYNAAATARSILHKKVRQLRAHSTKPSQLPMANKQQILAGERCSIEDNTGNTSASGSSSAVEAKTQSMDEGKKQSPAVRRTELPKDGDVVEVSSLGRKATVLSVDPAKKVVVVQAGKMKMKLKLTDIKA